MLFKRCDTDQISYFINEESSKIPNCAELFEFIGIFLAKAIWDKIPLNLCLNPLILRYLLGNKEDADIEDVKHFDTHQYKSLKYINENNINEETIFE